MVPDDEEFVMEDDENGEPKLEDPDTGEASGFEGIVIGEGTIVTTDGDGTISVGGNYIAEPSPGIHTSELVSAIDVNSFASTPKSTAALNILAPSM